MRLRLLKSFTNSVKKFPVGQVLNVSGGKARELIDNGTAVKYDGPVPPKGKMKTEFFKPKN